MLSITGMTLEQFADLMEGLGYKSEKAERPKVKAEAAPVEAESTADEAPSDAPVAEDTPAEDAPTEVAPEAGADVEAPAPEVEVFYTFTWGRKPQRQGGGGKPQGQRPQGDKPRGKGKGKPRREGAPQKTKKFEARPPRKEKPIDPDNPFAAALMGLKDKG